MTMKNLVWSKSKFETRIAEHYKKLVYANVHKGLNQAIVSFSENIRGKIYDFQLWYYPDMLKVYDNIICTSGDILIDLQLRPDVHNPDTPSLYQVLKDMPETVQQEIDDLKEDIGEDDYDPDSMKGGRDYKNDKKN